MTYIFKTFHKYSKKLLPEIENQEQPDHWLHLQHLSNLSEFHCNGQNEA